MLFDDDDPAGAARERASIVAPAQALLPVTPFPRAGDRRRDRHSHTAPARSVAGDDETIAGARDLGERAARHLPNSCHTVIMTRAERPAHGRVESYARQVGLEDLRYGRSFAE
jgi:hypothetical protein